MNSPEAEALQQLIDEIMEEVEKQKKGKKSRKRDESAIEAATRFCIDRRLWSYYLLLFSDVEEFMETLPLLARVDEVDREAVS